MAKLLINRNIIGVIFIYFFSNFCYSQNTKFCHNDSIEVELIIPTFLGNEKRNYYGNNAPDSLNIIWSHNLGEGRTVISRKIGERIWAGAGWTGQPLLVQEDSSLFLLQGAYDHNLKKINADNGEIVWQYLFDDVVKGTGSIWHNKNADKPENSLVILQGSRLGVDNFLDYLHIPSYRAISYFSGKELWRLDVKFTPSYSRDVDGSALILNDTAYLGLENALFTVFDPDHRNATIIDSMLQPKIFQESKLYYPQDVISHKNNIVTESSPCLLNNKIFVSSGSGHVFGYNLKLKKIDWEFFTGSDMDGSVVVTNDSCIIFTIEKQYISGNGGVMKINPFTDEVKWFFPTDSVKYAGWEGGVIGSAGISDFYTNDTINNLAAFTGIDGYLYVIKHESIEESDSTEGPNLLHTYKKPQLVFKKKIGPSISTPIIVNDKLIAASYDGIYLFKYDENFCFTLLCKFEASFESTPIVYNKKIYIASRDGNLYCFGN